MAPKMKHAKGERLNIRFNSKIKLEYHGARLASDDSVSLIVRFLEKSDEYQRKW